MYTSSDGTKKDVKQMNTEYIINALGKCSREQFNAKTLEEFNKVAENIYILQGELNLRVSEFLTKKIDEEGWL